MKGLTIHVTATVALTARDWQLYTYELEKTPKGRARLAQAVLALNEAASRALSCGDPYRAWRIFNAERSMHEEAGAEDSEPREVFERMWQKVYR